MKGSNRGIMWRLTRREIRNNWLQFASMIAITLLAVTLFCGFLSNTKTLAKAVDEFFEETNLCDLSVQMGGSLTDDDREYFESLDRGGYGVTSMQYRFYYEGSIGSAAAKIYVGGAASDPSTISHPYMEEGAGDDSGAMVEEKTAEVGGYARGTATTVSMSLPLEIGGMSLTYDFEFGIEVTGYMTFPEASSDSSSVSVYINDDVFEAILESEFGGLVTLDDMYDQVVIRCDDPASLKETINAHYASGETDSRVLFIYDRDTMETPLMLTSEVSQSRKMIYVFPVIFVIVSVFVILTTVNRLILEDRSEIGTLKALGFRDGRILRHYAGIGGVLCLIGGVVGAVIGPFIIPNVMKIKYVLAYGLPWPAMPSFSVWWSILAVVVVAALAFVIGMAVCRRVVREQPAQSMRPVPPDERRRDKRAAGERTAKRREREKAKEAARRGISADSRGLSLKMASRNILIKPGRALVTVIGVMGCVALLVCAFGIGDTVDNSLRTELYVQFSHDISTTFSTELSAEDFRERAEAIDGVETCETYTVYYMTATAGEMKRDIEVHDMSAGMTMTTIDTDGDGEYGTVVMAKDTADYLGVGSGDTVTLSSGSTEIEVTVDDVVQTAITRGVFFQAPQGALSGVVGIPSAWIKAESGVDPATLIDAVKEAAGTSDATTTQETWDYVQDLVSSISTMEITMMVFALLLSVVVLYNLSLLNVKERKRDIATMKVLGVTDARISLSLLYEVMLLTIVGTVLGLALGWPITYLIMSINQVEIMSFIYCVRPLSFVWSALISLCAALVINLLFWPSIRKVNMTESLKSVE